MSQRGSILHGVPLLNAVVAISLVLPLLAGGLYPAWRLPQFTPRQIIYSKDIIPLILAPWASPPNDSAQLLRIFHAFVVTRLPQVCILQGYALWFGIAISRTLSGFLLSRSVGWAYPRLFSHWALYETTSGIGPALSSYLLLYGARPWAEVIASRVHRYSLESVETMAIVCFWAVSCWIDSAPWTYTIAILVAVAITMGRILCSQLLRNKTYHPMALDGQDPPRRPRTIFQNALASFFVLGASGLLCSIIFRPPLLTMPSSPSSSAPPLEVLILSYPRPSDVASSESLLSRTISSYLPYVADKSVALSVFTHASPHASFAHAKDYFAKTEVQFYADEDRHPDAYTGQHLHVAEAFRWASEKRPGPAEWVMLVEDDFPVCGNWGWRGVLGVMNELEKGRSSATVLKRLGGFVGTGGSGLIVHHSLLPLLSFMMRAHADIQSPLLALHRRPADIIIQDCLLGVDPLCPHNPDGSSLVITSKLVMDHIGGNASTAQGRVYDMNKWRCGWRHPFHGRPEVEVVPV